MDFVVKWQQQLNESLARSAALAATIQDVDLEYALLAMGVLWPLREPVQEFDIEAIAAVKKLLGSQAKHVLRCVQNWDDDMMATARNLSQQLSQNSDLDAALNVLIKHFKAFFIFTEAVTNQAQAIPPDDAVSDKLDIPAKPQPGGEIVLTPVLASRVFISYARKDGEVLAREIRQWLEQEEISIWQDRVKMEGGRDWWLQITEALNQVEFMVLVATPAALQSEAVRKEWRYARQQGVCVYPVKGGPDLDFTELPRWMRNVHFYDPEQEWSKLVEDLKNPCETPRVPFMVEELPEDFVPRTGQMKQLIGLLLAENGDPIATTVALYGTGGYGKTMLAKSLCHNDDIRQAFDDGILWITLGENPGDLTGRVVDLIEVLSGERPGFSGLDAAETRLGQLLADRDILMVIDDVWNVAHLRPFTRGGGHCARLITTRNIAALPPKSHTVEVEAMQRSEAVALLSRGLPAEDTKTLEQLADRLGEWPLLLKLTNSTLRDRVHNNQQPLPAALTYVNKALDKRGLTAFDAHNAAARDQAVGQTLDVNQELLTDGERSRYKDLAIFPSEVNIPLSLLQKLWGATAGLDDFDTEELCDRFDQLSLLAHFDPNEHYISLQNIVRNYLAHEQSEKLAELHQTLLDAFAADLPQAPSGMPRWAFLPVDESYLWRHLAYHLTGAERGDELVETVKNLSYLSHKTFLRTAYAVEADMLAARQTAPDDATLTRLHQAFSQSSHLLNQCETLNRVANTLHSRLEHVPALTRLVTEGEVDLPKPLLTAYRRLPDLPASNLIRALGHRGPVFACDISTDGSRVVTIARDNIVRVWDAHIGAELLTLEGHKVAGNSCVISNDGRLAASGTADGVLKIWDAECGSERFSITAHDGPIFRCALSGDGKMVVTASKDRTLKVWDTTTGANRLSLTGHNRAVTGCDITPDGGTIVSCSSDGTVKIWNARTGQLRTTIKAYENTEIQNPVANLTFSAATSALLSCAISSDGSMVVSVLPDGILKIWDAQRGTERATLTGHTGWVENCTISTDGRHIVSVSNDKTIKGWDARTGVERFTLEGHLRTVSGCALNGDGTVLVTASQDKTAKLWDFEGAAEPSPTASYTDAAQCCAISADGSTIIFDTPGNALAVVDVETDTLRFELKKHMRPITGCVISADGSTIITASQDRTLKIWDGRQGRERQILRGHTWAVNDCALSRDGSIIVSVSEDSTLKVWDANSGTQRFTLAGHMRGVNGCVISPAGDFIVSAAADKTLKIWDAHTGRERLTLVGHEGPVNDSDVSPDGLCIASVSNDDTLIIWDSQSGEILQTLKGHTGSVLQCAFNPNGQHLLSVSKDGSVKLWEVQSGKCLTTLLVDGSLAHCAWFPDGRRIIAVGARGVYFLQVIW